VYPLAFQAYALATLDKLGSPLEAGTPASPTAKESPKGLAKVTIDDPRRSLRVATAWGLWSGSSTQLLPLLWSGGSPVKRLREPAERQGCEQKGEIAQSDVVVRRRVDG
jgi:hypothetical protein